MTKDEADLALLSHANEKLKFGFLLGANLSLEMQSAFERGIDNDWFTLVDLAHINAMPWPFMRIFKLTHFGIAQLETLKRMLK